MGRKRKCLFKRNVVLYMVHDRFLHVSPFHSKCCCILPFFPCLEPSQPSLSSLDSQACSMLSRRSFMGSFSVDSWCPIEARESKVKDPGSKTTLPRISTRHIPTKWTSPPVLWVGDPQAWEVWQSLDLSADTDGIPAIGICGLMGLWGPPPGQSASRC